MLTLFNNIKSCICVCAMLLVMSGCTMRLNGSTFIASSDTPVAFSDEFTQELRAAIPNGVITQVNIQTSDLITLSGFHIDNPSSQKTLIFFQGNGMKIEPYGKSALRDLWSLGTDIFVLDRRGLGASEGEPSIKSLINDAQLQLDYLHQHYQPQQVILHGYSLGSFIAADLAKNNKIDALVLHGSATNAEDWVAEKTPWYISPFMTLEISEDFRNADNLKVVSVYYNGPLLVIAGENDEEVPTKLAKKLFAQSKSANKQLIMVPNIGHQGMLENDDTMTQYQEFVGSL